MDFQEIEHQAEKIIPSKFRKHTPLIIAGVIVSLVAFVNRKPKTNTIEESGSNVVNTKLPDDVMGIIKDTIQQNNEQLEREISTILDNNKTMYESTIQQIIKDSETKTTTLSSQVENLQSNNQGLYLAFTEVSNKLSTNESLLNEVKSNISEKILPQTTTITTPTVVESKPAVVQPVKTPTSTTPAKTTTTSTPKTIAGIPTIIDIKKGDTLSSIAQKTGTTVSEIMKANPQITNANKIYAGDMLVIPK